MESFNILTDEIKITTSEMSGWLKLVGIVSIVLGGIFAITIVGLLAAWLPIWQGILLLRAGNNFNNLREDQQKAILSGLKNLKIFFIIQGIVLLLTIGSIIVSLLVVGIPGMMNSFRGLY